MGSYTVKTVQGPRVYGEDKDWGPMHEFVLILDGVDKPVELSQKPTTAAPVADARLDLDLEPHPRFPEKFKGKRVRAFNGSGGGPRPEDPKRSRAILRQHSQHMALLYVANQAADKRPQSWAEFWALVDKFDVDVERVREAA